MQNDVKKLYRSRSDRMFSGLCGGLGQYIGIDPTVVRVIFAILGVFTFPLPLLLYFVMMLIVPEEPGPAVTIVQQ